MDMLHKHLVPLLAGAALALELSSCSGLIYREADVPPADTMVWLECTLRTGDTIARVNLTPAVDVRFEAEPSPAWNELTPLEADAQIFLYRNDQLYCGPFLTAEFQDKPFCLLPEPLRAWPDTLRLEVLLADGRQLRATQITPTCVPIAEVNTRFDVPLQAMAPFQGTVEVTFDDPPDEQNFYSVHVLMQRKVGFFSSDFADSEIVLSSHQGIPRGGGGLLDGAPYGPWLLDDSQFDGQSVTLVFHFAARNDGPLPDQAWTFVTLSSLTPEGWQWEYHRRLLDQSEELGPFAEPVYLPMNVEGGLGTFHVECRSEMKQFW